MLRIKDETSQNLPLSLFNSMTEEQKRIFHEEDIHPDDSPPVPREMTSKELQEAINCAEIGMAAYKRTDTDFAKFKSECNFLNGITCYKEILKERG